MAWFQAEQFIVNKGLLHCPGCVLCVCVCVCVCVCIGWCISMIVDNTRHQRELTIANGCLLGLLSNEMFKQHIA